MNQTSDSLQLGVTFQISLDALIEESATDKHVDQQAYIEALNILKRVSTIRNATKKCDIALEALTVCPECIEAYETYGVHLRDDYKRLQILRYGTERATMNVDKTFFVQKNIDFYDIKALRPLLSIKYAYAKCLFEMGSIQKANHQFQELLNLNPSNEYHALTYLYACLLHLDSLEQCQLILKKYHDESTLTYYVKFLLYLKLEEINKAVQILPLLHEKNSFLYDMMTYRLMDTAVINNTFIEGSIEEASHIFKIMANIFSSMGHLPRFMVDYKKYKCYK